MEILIALRQHQPLYFQEMVEKLHMHRQVLSRNLKVLVRKKIITGEKIGVRKYYRLIVTKEVADCIISFLHDGGILTFKRKIEKLRRLFKKPLDVLEKTGREVNTYEPELVELAASTKDVPYAESILTAKTMRWIKKEKKKIGLSSETLLEKEKTLIKEKFTTPKKPVTKTINAPSGNKYLIRKFSVFELQNIYEKMRNISHHNREMDSDFKNWLEAYILLSN